MEREFNIRNTAKSLLLVLSLCCAGVPAMQAQTCEGRVCMKNGSRLLYTGNDRLEMPYKKHDVQVYRDFFSRQCQRDMLPIDKVDSVVVWSSSAPQGARVLVPLPGVGWSWLYIDHPRLQVYIYASQGYSLNASGGMKAWQGNRMVSAFFIPSKTTCDFYVMQPGGKPECLGDTYKKCDKTFVRRLCRCAGLTQEHEKQLLASGETNRSDVILQVIDMIDKENTEPKEKIEDENKKALAAADAGSGAATGSARTQE